MPVGLYSVRQAMVTSQSRRKSRTRCHRRKKRYGERAIGIADEAQFVDLVIYIAASPEPRARIRQGDRRVDQ